MFIGKEFRVICRMSFLSLDILLTGPQESEYVVGTRRAVGFAQRVAGLSQRAVGFAQRAVYSVQRVVG